MNLSENRKKLTKQGALTPWRQRREGLVRTPKISLSRKAHSLPGDNRGKNFQEMERSRLSEAHSRAGDGRVMYLSRHGKESSERKIPTNYRR